MRAFLALVLLAGCGEQVDPNAVTWHSDIKPIAQRVCASCHNGEGVGPGDFTTYEGLWAAADIARAYVEEGEMPPPFSDPDCRPYGGSDNLTLTEEERALFLRWVDEGKKEGEPTDEPDYEAVFEPIEPDAVLQVPAEYTLQPDEGGNDYRCFVVDWTPETDLSVTALGLQLDNAAVVHHTLLFRDPNKDAGAGYGAPVGSKSFGCANPIMESDWEPLHAWAPGMPPTHLPERHGLALEAGDQLVLQMHYFVEDPDEVQTDQSAYVLETTTEPVNRIYYLPGALTDFVIPAGDPEYTYSVEYDLTELPVTANLWGVFPHMHLLGTRYEATIQHPDDAVDCVVRGEWEFNHQMSYMFEEPIRVEPGSTLTGSCTWDNSADNPNQVHDPPQDLTWGEGTDDEMCVFLMYVAVALP